MNGISVLGLLVLAPILIALIGGIVTGLVFLIRGIVRRNRASDTFSEK